MRLSLEQRKSATDTSRHTPDASVRISRDRLSLLELQRNAGNQVVQSFLHAGLLQPKLTIGPVDDPLEREADEMAAHIPSGPSAHEESARSKPTGNPPQLRSLYAGVSSNIPGAIGQALQSGGKPLDSATRAFFEPRFGHDFSHVRIHTGSDASESARSIQAHAYTTGSDIVFDHGQFSPHSSQGRSLLAHELTHVIQQQGPDSSGHKCSGRISSPLIQRSPAPQGHLILPPSFFSSDDAKERSKWRAIVDQAVRKQFLLTGPGIEEAQVHYDSPKDLGDRFQGQSLEDALVTTFLDANNITATNILLSDDRVAYLARYSDPISDFGMNSLREFVREGIKNNSFKDSGGGPLDLSTHKPMYPPSTITPSELLATEFAGVTTSAGPRSSRRIDLLREIPSGQHYVFVGVFVHEACHFYTHDAYDGMINGIKDRDDVIGNARIGQILAEGVTELFAREVSKANEDDFGDLILSYPAETEQAARLVALLGEKTVQDAFFRGDAKALQQIAALVEQSRNDKFPDPIEAEKLFEPSHK